MDDSFIFHMTRQELRNLLTDVVTDIVHEAVGSYFPDDKNPAEDEALITTEEVCDIFGTTEQTLFAWRRNGKIPYYRISRRIYYKRSEITKALRRIDLK